MATGNRAPRIRRERRTSAGAFALALLAAVLLSTGCGPGDDGGIPGPHYTIGDVVEDFTWTDLDGRRFRLSELDADPARAMAAVGALAEEAGCEAPTRATRLENVPALTVDGTLEDTLAQAWIDGIGQRYGLFPAEDAVAQYATLGDLADWIAGMRKTPIVLGTWSPTCEASRWHDGVVPELLRSAGARYVAITGVCADRPADVLAYWEENANAPRTLAVHDEGFTISNRFACLRTCEFLVLDHKRRLRYHGLIQHHAQDGTGGTYLRDAIEAAKSGREASVSTHFYWRIGSRIER